MVKRKPSKRLCDDEKLVERVYAAMYPVLGFPDQMARAAITVVKKLTKQSGTTTGTTAMNLTDAVIEQLTAVFDAAAKEKAAFDAMVKQIEAEGYRINEGGQVSRDRWEYTDWRTGEVIAAGNVKDGEPDLPGKFQHIDYIHQETAVEPEFVPELPASLADAIIQWFYENEDEARAWMAAIRPEQR